MHNASCAIYGSLAAIISPMFEDGSLDLDSLKKLIHFHIENQTDAIVIVGTSGESPTVSMQEHSLLIQKAVEFANQRIPVIAGTGANSTSEAIELTEFAKQAGANMALSVVPYYNKPTQEGMYQHFKAIAERVDLPLILYNVPGRTVADLQNDTILRLAEIPNIVGIKDATGDLSRAFDLIHRSPKDFALYSGDDMTAVSTILMGYWGDISVTANVAPLLMHQMTHAALKGDVKTARRIHFQLLALHRDLFCEANPIPVKWAVSRLGLCQKGIRLPLTVLSKEGQQKVEAALKSADII